MKTEEELLKLYMQQEGFTEEEIKEERYCEVMKSDFGFRVFVLAAAWEEFVAPIREVIEKLADRIAKIIR